MLRKSVDDEAYQSLVEKYEVIEKAYMEVTERKAEQSILLAGTLPRIRVVTRAQPCRQGD